MPNSAADLPIPTETHYSQKSYSDSPEATRNDFPEATFRQYPGPPRNDYPEADFNGASYQPGFQPQPEESEKTQPPSRKKLPFGLSIIAYTFLVSLVTAIIIAAIVGGGVYAGVHKDGSSSTPSSTPTAGTATVTITAASTSTPTPSDGSVAVANYTAVDPSLVTNLVYDCPTIQSKLSDNTISCNYDSTGADLVGIYAYDIFDCIAACQSYNNFNSTLGGRQCAGLTWNSHMAAIYQRLHANCWLKYEMSNLNDCSDCVTVPI